jgi:opacity protein-like surface antigen
MNCKRMCVVAVALAAWLSAASAAQAQPSVMDYRWSFDVGLGWDNSLSGNINSGAIGKLNDQVAVVLPNSYSDVYGTGFHLRFGGGYLVDEVTEVRAIFTYQSLNADLTPMGDLGVSRLYGQYDPYRSFGLDVCFRRYFDANATMRAYIEATGGLGFISEIDVVLSAPSANMTERATDFYDRTAAVSFGGNAGLLWQLSDRIGMYGQVGLKWMSGLSEIDNLAGTGLETINDDSSRWTLPVVVGMRVRF